MGENLLKLRPRLTCKDLEVIAIAMRSKLAFRYPDYRDAAKAEELLFKCLDVVRAEVRRLADKKPLPRVLATLGKLEKKPKPKRRRVVALKRSRKGK
jgi:hypothetical protein